MNALFLDTKEAYMPMKKSARIIKKVRDEDGQWRFVSLRGRLVISSSGEHRRNGKEKTLRSRHLPSSHGEHPPSGPM
jgi:hypothetical protein